MSAHVSSSRSARQALLSLFAVLLACVLSAPPAHAASAAEIDHAVDQTLKAFEQIKGAKAFLSIAKGVLVFPKVYKAGIGIGVRQS